MKTYVRRCQGWVVMHPIGLQQCNAPAIDGTRCQAHQKQRPVEWMAAPRGD